MPSCVAAGIACLLLAQSGTACRSRAPRHQPAATAGANAGGDKVEYKDGAVTVTSSENGAQVTLGGAGTAMPAGWPAAFPLFPGAKVSLSFLREEDGGSQVVMLSSAAPPEELLDFYSAKAAAEGFVLSSEKRGPGSWARDFLTPTRAFNLAVQDSAAGVDVSLQLMEGRSNQLPAAPEIYWQGINALPPGWPAKALPALPGSSIEACASMPDGMRMKYRLQFASTRPPDEVQAFYRDLATAQGLSPTREQSSEATLVFEGRPGKLELSCFEAAESDKYLVTLYRRLESPAG